LSLFPLPFKIGKGFLFFELKDCLYQFQTKDDLKAAKIAAARRTEEYVE